MGEGGKPGDNPSLEMPTEEMRRLGHQVVDRIIDRWSALTHGPPWEYGTREELEPLLSAPPPEAPQGFEGALETALEHVLPVAGRIDHPRFFAFIPSSPTWPSILGDFLATGFNIFQGTWLESAGPSQLELVVLDWFRDWLGLPASGGGILTSGGSAANLSALVTARERAQAPADPVIYLSDQSHSSLERGARIIGLRSDNIRKIPTDDRFRMDVERLEEAVKEDRDSGRDPLCVCANAGATNTGAIDPLRSIGSVAREEDLWFHIDGAYGGFAVLAPEVRESFDGIETADSITLDPHKWLFQPYETGCLLVRDTETLEDAFRIIPEYLQDTALGKEQVNFADRGIQLTRGFRALKIWISVQTLGLRAFRDAIRASVDQAERAHRYICASPHLEAMAPPSLGIVCFRVRPSGSGLSPRDLEALNRRVQHEVVASRIAMISSTRLRGEYSLRLAILNYRSRWDDVRETLEAVEALARDGGGAPGGSA